AARRGTGLGGRGVTASGTGAVESACIAQTLRFEARRGSEYVFDKIVPFCPSGDGFADPADVSMHCSKRALERGYDRLIRAHEQSWADAWRSCDVAIQGDLDAQRAAGFSIYHSLACGRAPSARS